MKVYLENDLLRTKLKRLKDKLDQDGEAIAKADSSIGSSYLSKGRKIQSLITQILEVGTVRRSAVMFGWIFITLVGLTALLQGLQLGNIVQSITDIQTKMSVVETGYLRSNSLISMNEYARFWLAEIQGVFTIYGWEIDKYWYLENSQSALTDLTKWNNQLSQGVSELDQSFQDVFYRENINVYTRLDNGTLAVSSVNSNFQVVSQMISMMLTMINGDTSAAVISGRDLSPWRFILDNNLNSLLTSTENTARILSEDLIKTLADIRTRINLIYAFLMITIGCFAVLSLWYLLKLKSDSEKFMTMLFRINTQRCKPSQITTE